MELAIFQDTDALISRYKHIEEMYNAASVGDEKRHFFNVALAGYGSYEKQHYDVDTLKVDAFLQSSPLFTSVIRVYALSFEKHVPTTKELLTKRILDLEGQVKELKKLIKKL